MNIAIVFAGGTGQRMNTKSLPKQFLELHGKPIIIYTLEQFQSHEEINAIVVVSVDSWLDYCNDLIDKFHITKVKAIVHGGKTGQDSIFNGLNKAVEFFGTDHIVLIHDGVRPLIDHTTISNNIATVKEYGSAITVVPAIETVVMGNEDGTIGRIVDRSKCSLARAPQSFYLQDIYRTHLKAQAEQAQFIDSASMMQHYGYILHPVNGTPENIKITTPSDFYIFRAILDARENSQIFGV